MMSFAVIVLVTALSRVVGAAPSVLQIEAEPDGNGAAAMVRGAALVADFPNDAPALPAFLKADSVSANATARDCAAIISLPCSSPNQR